MVYSFASCSTWDVLACCWSILIGCISSCFFFLEAIELLRSCGVIERPVSCRIRSVRLNLCGARPSGVFLQLEEFVVAAAFFARISLTFA